LVNITRNNKVNSLLDKFISNRDPLNKLLLNIFSKSRYIRGTIKENFTINNNKSYLDSIVINSLKHMNMAGVRIEAKGRLTRRFTASRSVFKAR